MIQDELKYRIRQALGLTPTMEQEQAIDVFTQFMTDRSEQVAMILRLVRVRPPSPEPSSRLWQL